MVVKQKGGEFGEFHIPEKLLEYFECVMNLFRKINEFIDNLSKKKNVNFKSILELFDYYLKLNNFMINEVIFKLKRKIEDYKKNEILKYNSSIIFNVRRLPLRNMKINDFIPRTNNKIKELLFELSNIIMDHIIPQIYNKCNVPNLVKLYIALLLIKYIREKNLSNNNPLIMGLYRVLSIRDLQIEIRNLFFKVKFVPIFYGNGYNQFICEKVGVFSSNKRKYTINPVAAIARTLISSDEFLNKYSPLYILLSKILRFKYYEGTQYNSLPKLISLPEGTIFCIVKDINRNEEVITSDLSRCSKKGFGCSLKMTAEIRKENIASNEDIFNLLSILLNMYLEKGEAHRIQTIKNLNNLRLRRNQLRNNQPYGFSLQQFNNSRNLIINRRQATIRRIQTLKKDIHNLEKNLNQSNQNSDFNYKSNLLESLIRQLEILEKT